MKTLILAIGFLMAGQSALAESETLTVPVFEAKVSGKGEQLGQITLHASEHGVVLTPDLKGLQQGVHGFHLHTNPSCEPGMKENVKTAALEAGGHYDPHNADHHDAPWADGHLGDLPALYVDADGKAETPVLAPRLTMKDVQNKAIMIHQGGDTFSDNPEPLGGGGPRVACGVIGSL